MYKVYSWFLSVGERCSKQVLQNLADLSGQISCVLDMQLEQKIPKYYSSVKIGSFRLFLYPYLHTLYSDFYVLWIECTISTCQILVIKP
jgi:hypothetical protein